jgi:hypothetical protein
MVLLAALVVLHALGLWGLAQFTRLRERPPKATPVTRLLLLDLAPAQRAPDAALRVPPPRRRVEAPLRTAPPDVARTAPAVGENPAAAPPPAPAARFVDPQGRLRVSRRLAEEMDAAAAAADAAAEAEAASTFHVPRGDDWLMREPRKVLVYEPTVFDEAYMPDDMNPIEEACWRNRALQMVLASLGSIDCAAPGKEAPQPTPAMIVYGEDDADDILRKTEDWQRYNRH